MRVTAIRVQIQQERQNRSVRRAEKSHCQASMARSRGLKLSYLRCEHAAQTGRLQSGAIAHCSGIYYELKERAFDKDFGRFRAWYMPIVASQGLGGSSMVVSRDLTVRPACD
jgi:hypothetical protein